MKRYQDAAHALVSRAVALLRQEHARAKTPGAEPRSYLAALVRLSPSYFTVAFKRDFGETPRAYLNRRRIARAMELMLDTDEPLSRIAVACGLSDQSHFSRLFRKVQRTSPARWRRLRRGSPGSGLLSSGVSR